MQNRIGIRELHSFVRGKLVDRVFSAYRRFEILSEADLQALVWMELRQYIKKAKDPRFRVHCEPYIEIREPGIRSIHPDIVIFKDKDPWVLFELKELGQRVTVSGARKERERLLQCMRIYGAKRGYLLSVARELRKDQEPKALTGPKGEGSRFFFEVPVILEERISHDELEKWIIRFKEVAKCRR